MITLSEAEVRSLQGGTFQETEITTGDPLEPGFSPAELEEPGTPSFQEPTADLTPTNQVREEINKTTGQKKFHCKLCDYCASLKCHVVLHIRRQHNNSNSSTTPTTSNMSSPYHQKSSLSCPLSGVDLARAIQERVSAVKQEVTDDANATLGSEASSSGLDTPSTEVRKMKVFLCTQCSHRGNSKEQALEHFRECHSQGDMYACSLCTYMTDFSQEIRQHVQREHSKRIPDSYIHVQNCYTVSTRWVDEEGADVVRPASRTFKKYRCKLCPSRTSAFARYSVIRHINKYHPDHAGDKDSLVEEFVSHESTLRAPQAAFGIIRCTVCPYTTNKLNQMKLHRSYHKPCPGNHYKCRFCNYYVPTPRQLQYHHKLHTQGPRVHASPGDSTITQVDKQPATAQLNMESDTNDDIVLPTERADLERKFVTPSTATRRITKTRFRCAKCPYLCSTKNQFLFHKQLHRPRPWASFKCEQCGLSTNQQGQLTLHMRVHAPHYQAAVEMGVVRKHSYQSLCGQILADQPNTPKVPQVSPTKSEGIDSTAPEDEVQLASMKHSIIASKIKHVPVTPQKVEVPVRRGLGSEEEGQVITSVIQETAEGECRYRTYYKCHYCPWATVRFKSLKLHEQMHGYREGFEWHKCPHCDYYVKNRGLLGQHVRVHSRQFMPGRDFVDDVEAPGRGEDGEGVLTELDQQETARRMQQGGLMSMNSLSGKTAANRSSQYYIRKTSSSEAMLEPAHVKKWCCEKCPYETVKRVTFEKHLQLHGCRQRYTCAYCDYSVPGYHLLQQHQGLHYKPNPHLLNIQSVSNLTYLPEVPSDIAMASGYNQSDPSSNADSLDLFENSASFLEPKKNFECERCPYTTSRRDYIITHMKFHLIRSAYSCPHCNYSVSKVPLLNQHIRIHFEAAGGGKRWGPDEELKESDFPPDGQENGEKMEVGEEETTDSMDTVWLCQYCDIALHSVAKLKHHESLHLLGNEAS